MQHWLRGGELPQHLTARTDRTHATVAPRQTAPRDRQLEMNSRPASSGQMS